MFRTHAPDSRAEDLAEGVVVVRHEVTYVSSLTFGFEPVAIECWVTEIRAASFTMGYEIFAEDDAGERTVYLRARTVLTPYVFATERPRRLHDEEKVVARRACSSPTSRSGRRRRRTSSTSRAGRTPSTSASATSTSTATSTT